MIVAAAIKHKGIVFTGARHCEIIKYLVRLGYKPPIPNNEQGFITHKGKFLSRPIARSEARNCGQIAEGFVAILTSEDLW